MNSLYFKLASSKIGKQLKLMLIIEAILLLVTYGLLNKSYHNIEIQKTHESILQLNHSLLANIQYSADTLDTLTKALISNDSFALTPSLWSYLISDSKKTTNLTIQEALFIDKYHQLNLLLPHLNAFFLFDTNGKVINFRYNDTQYHILDDLTTHSLLPILKEKKGALLLLTQDEITPLGYTPSANILFAGRILNNLVPSKPVAIVIGGINISNIYTAFESQKIFPSQEFACFDANGKLLFASNPSTMPTWEQLQQTSPRDPISYELIYGKQHELYSVIGTDKKDIRRASNVIDPFFLLIVPGVILGSLLISTLIIRNIIQSYRKMAEHTYQQSLAEKDLNLQMLRSQINPHFLYNTLDSMRMASLNVGFTHLATMCELLAKILRYGVSNTKHLVTIEEETAHLNDYISLINLHYANVSIGNYIDPSIYNYKIIKLLLQPIVENCLNHGIADNIECGSIQVWGYAKGDKLVFTISDNGIGMNEEKLTLLQDYLDDKNTAFNSIGLRNIKKRIQLYYGDDSDLVIESQLQQGTSVTVTIPII